MADGKENSKFDPGIIGLNNSATPPCALTNKDNYQVTLGQKNSMQVLFQGVTFFLRLEINDKLER